MFPYSQEDLESPDFIFDSPETKSGVQGVCAMINNKLSEFLKGKELPLTKPAMTTISSWAARLKSK